MQGTRGGNVMGSRDPRIPVGQIGEFELISRITEVFAHMPAAEVGPGDDAAVVSVPGGRVVAGMDLLVDGVHFRRDWSSGVDVGVKAAAQNLADIVAMGAVPTALLVGLAIPPELAVSWPIDVAEGLRIECDRLGVSVVGGDLTKSDRICVAVTALGHLGSRGAVLRSGARLGDLVAVSSIPGASSAGLAVLQRGFTAPRAAVAAHRRPQPDYAAGLLAAASAHALIDVSDGLIADAGHIARASGVTLDIDRSSVTLPAVVEHVAAALGADPWDWVLGGGEDHAFLGTFAPDEVPDGFWVIGSVVAAAPTPVLVDGAAWLGPMGHDHFGPD
jgi:thiamine-monophosphate kinase